MHQDVWLPAVQECIPNLQLLAGLPLPPGKIPVATNGLTAAPAIGAVCGCVGKRSRTAQS